MVRWKPAKSLPFGSQIGWKSITADIPYWKPQSGNKAVKVPSGIGDV